MPRSTKTKRRFGHISIEQAKAAVHKARARKRQERKALRGNLNAISKTR